MIFKKRIILLKKKKNQSNGPKCSREIQKEKKLKTKKQNQTPTPSETIGNQQCIYTFT